MSLWSSPVREIEGHLNSENVTSILDVKILQAIIVVIKKGKTKGYFLSKKKSIFKADLSGVNYCKEALKYS